MNTLNNNNINMFDLPDEILLVIFNKLTMIDMLYSLVDVNQRFDRLTLNSLHIRDLDLTTTSFNVISPVNDKVLDRICESILPRIHSLINKFTLEPLSMERILGTIDYPQLHSLSLVNFQPQTLLRHLTGDTKLFRLVADKITHLNIGVTDKITTELSHENESNLFALILSLAKHLSDLTFCQLFSDTESFIVLSNLPLTSCTSSYLTKLDIHVNTFDDCLYLLDGRLECLSTLIIVISEILSSSSNIDNAKLIPKLKCFSLVSFSHTFAYDSRIVPLLRRMAHLEELTLFLSIMRSESTYIDGTHLYDDVLIHMPRLSKFTFSINNYVVNKGITIVFPSNADIQRSFNRKGYEKVGSYVDDKPTKTKGKCHVYSLPYQFECYVYMTASFQGGRFEKVRALTMCDTSPFEHEFFRIISESFPFLRKLILYNYEPQKNKQRSAKFIAFSHLVELDLSMVHVDYVTQFLFKTNTQLPRLIHLIIKYELLAEVTNSFTNDVARLNCSQVKKLVIVEPFVRPENFLSYFPLL